MAKIIPQALTCLFAICLSTIALGQGATAEDPYLDNRSDPSSLMMSYYNALNRGEYARAWSYWHEQADAGAYSNFFEDVADRRWAELSVGEVVAEGAAGSLYYTLPISVIRTLGDKNQTSLSGCVVMRLVQPAIQEPPFTPLHIESLDLMETSLEPAAALANACQ